MVVTTPQTVRREQRRGGMYQSERADTRFVEKIPFRLHVVLP